MPATVFIYTTTYCGYCHRAKALLKKKNASFTEIDVTDRRDLRAWLVDASAQRTVPQIFINGRSIGGFDELAALAQAGRLDALLAVEPAEGDPVLPE